MQGLYKQLCNTTLQIEGGLKAYLVVNGLVLHLINFIFSYYQWCLRVSDCVSRSWTRVVTLFFFFRKQLISYVTQFQFEGVFSFQHVLVDSCSYIQLLTFSHIILLVSKCPIHVFTFNHIHFLILYYQRLCVSYVSHGLLRVCLD